MWHTPVSTLAVRPLVETTNVFHMALACAACGWYVFPLTDKKRTPAIKKFESGGATTDPQRIAEWFGPQSYHDCGYAPRGEYGEVGILTGAESKIWVLDIDVKPGVNGFVGLLNVLRQHGTEELPRTFTVQSWLGAGRNYYFRWPDDGRVVGNSVSKVAPGVDSRGWHGYVRAPVSVYRILDPTAPVPAPDWLVDLVVKRPPVIRINLNRPAVAIHRSVVAGVKKQAGIVSATAGVSGGNMALNNAAFALGCYGALGLLDRDTAYNALREAAWAFGPPLDRYIPKFDGTFNRGWDAGLVAYIGES
jgi:hypothetical protein